MRDSPASNSPAYQSSFDSSPDASPTGNTRARGRFDVFQLLTQDDALSPTDPARKPTNILYRCESHATILVERGWN
jgi:hypothetical protein